MRIVVLLALLGGCAAPLATHAPQPAGVHSVARPLARPVGSEAVRSAPTLGRLGAEVHAEANGARTRAARRALGWDPDLATVAQEHSRDMARRGYFDHVAPDGQDPQARARRGGVTCRIASGPSRIRLGIAENLYMTTRYASRWERGRGPHREVRYDWMTADQIAEAAVRSWLRSPGHRRNLLDGAARAHGIGVAVGRDHRVYITQVLC